MSLSFGQVTGDDDLWSLVLSFLPLPDAVRASLACHAHLGLALRSRQGVTSLWLETEHLQEDIDRALALGMGLDTTYGLPKLRIAECGASRTSCMSTHCALHDWSGQVLPTVAAFHPRLQHLHISLDPARYPGGRGYRYETLAKTINLFNPALATEGGTAAEPVKQGCLPWALLGCTRLEALELKVVIDADMAEELRGGRRAPRARREGEPTHQVPGLRLESVFLSAVLSSCRSLRKMDLRGLAPAVLETLLSLELPSLLQLRCGNGDHPDFNDLLTWPAALLPRVSEAFPTLVALDVAYATTTRGVSYADVEALCRRCTIRHLDLSQVMTYVDFGYPLLILGRLAPQLRSLAVHGLLLPDEALAKFATGCPHLHRLKLIASRYSNDGLGSLLRAARELVHLNLSGGTAPHAELVAWVEERRGGPMPVQSLELRRCIPNAKTIATALQTSPQCPTIVTCSRGLGPQLFDCIDDPLSS